MILAVIKRNWQMYKRYFPITLFLNRILDAFFQLIVFWLIANYMFTNQSKIGSGYFIKDYFTYAAIGMIFYNVSVAVLMNVGRSLITEVKEGTLESLLITPYKVRKYYFGVFIEQLGRTCIECMCTILLALMLGAEILSISPVVWILGTVYVSLISFCMGVLLSNIMLWLRDTFLSQNTLFVVIFLLSGITFPRHILPIPLSFIGELIPLTHALEFIRMLMTSNYTYNDIFNVVLKGLIGAVIYYLVGLFYYKKVEQKVIGYISY
ncbi:MULTISPECIES: ABC transporter permease [Streptococcus]|jgi:ABC transporter family protein|uniref:Transport permease protein n=2 Tax=Streptococcus TaxID=1301 RepID=E1LLE8_STRMT|nr:MULTISPECIES: ABC transporter permease [Streptococcus]BDT64513.1 ABC transporter [Streptococcus sp. SP4011]AEL10661.1 ABC transporter permease [Streptococcus pseudopneumoniae IS7493]EFN98919.1 ABC-2 type transporter family protein [Streptococcus mitis SK564]MBF9646260.1 ABC transporter permease [Streptococcus pseudopneumoniae]MBF9656708.1 ABC transporter permease [Streptococcus pseudopneumoniae]